MTNTREEKRAYWSRLVKEWQASGETQSNYCRRHKLKLHQLIYWKQLFDGKTRIKKDQSSSDFVSVKMTENSVPQGLTLRLPNGLQLDGIHTNNLALVREIIGWQS